MLQRCSVLQMWLYRCILRVEALDTISGKCVQCAPGYSVYKTVSALDFPGL